MWLGQAGSLDARRAGDRGVAELTRHGMSSAVCLVARWPHDAGVLDPGFVDGVLVRAHLQLSEEFGQGERMRALRAPLLSAVRREGVPGPY